MSLDTLPEEITRDRFLVWRSPRIGLRNPHRLPSPVWAWLAQHPEINAWQINEHFDGPSSFEVGPCWCAQRFGQTTTELEDGTRVLLGGEHEDHYDPDFYIYNDALVVRPSGEVEIYAYPIEDFAPTDFHTATRAGDRVVLVGGLGFTWMRDASVTQVHVLDTSSFAMQRHVTRHADGAATLATATAPGWIHKHQATLSADARSILVTGGEHLFDVEGTTRFVRNADDWSLDVERLVWTRLTHRTWRQLSVHRVDGSRNALFDIAMLKYHVPEKSDFDRKQVARFVETHGRLFSTEAYDAIYVPPVPHERILPPDDADTYPLVVHLVIDGVDVRYAEGSEQVELVIEGALPDDVVETLVTDLEHKLTALEGVPYARTVLR